MPSARPAAATASGTPGSANVCATRETPSSVSASPAPRTAISRCALRPRYCALRRARTSATSKAASTARCTPPASRCLVEAAARPDVRHRPPALGGRLRFDIGHEGSLEQSRFMMSTIRYPPGSTTSIRRLGSPTSLAVSPGCCGVGSTNPCHGTGKRWHHRMTERKGFTGWRGKGGICRYLAQPSWDHICLRYVDASQFRDPNLVRNQ